MQISLPHPYTLADFFADFPDDRACLEWLVQQRWPDGIFCSQCNRVTRHHLVEARRSYSCQYCGHHTHPTAGTIFHKSSTPLVFWFYTIFKLASSPQTFSAKQIERDLGVTYKTAWRMVHLIRVQMAKHEDVFWRNRSDDSTTT